MKDFGLTAVKWRETCLLRLDLAGIGYEMSLLNSDMDIAGNDSVYYSSAKDRTQHKASTFYFQLQSMELSGAAEGWSA